MAKLETSALIAVHVEVHHEGTGDMLTAIKLTREHFRPPRTAVLPSGLTKAAKGFMYTLSQVRVNWHCHLIGKAAAFAEAPEIYAAHC